MLPLEIAGSQPALRRPPAPSKLAPLALVLLAACGQGTDAIGGPGATHDRSPTAPAPNCQVTKSWSTKDPDADGLEIAREATGQIMALAADDTFVFYLVQGERGPTKLMRVVHEGGPAEPIATFTASTYDALALDADSVYVVAFNGVLTRVPKAGGEARELVQGASWSPVVDDQGRLYVARDSNAWPRDGVRVVRVEPNGATTPVLRAPDEIAPYGVRSFAVHGDVIAWAPEQVGKLVPAGEPVDRTPKNPLAVYVTKMDAPDVHSAVYGPYDGTWLYDLQMDARHVYLGHDFGLLRAEYATLTPAVPFGPRGVGAASNIVVDQDMVYFRARDVSAIGGGPESIVRVPKDEGAPEWLVEQSGGNYGLDLTAASCTIFWRRDGVLFARPKAASGRNAPIPSVSASGTGAP